MNKNADKSNSGCVFINIFIMVVRTPVRKRMEYAWLLLSGTKGDAAVSVDVHLFGVL